MVTPQPLDPLTLGEPPKAATAGQEDHSDPGVFTGDEADPPEDAGEPPVEERGQEHDIDRILLLPEDRN